MVVDVGARFYEIIEHNEMKQGDSVIANEINKVYLQILVVIAFAIPIF